MLMKNHDTEKIVLSPYLENLSSIHEHDTRSRTNKNYYLPSVRTNLGKTSFSFNGPKIWNNLPCEIRNASNFSFKRKLKNYLIERYI